MKLDDLIAIDVHTHAEVSCRQPHDEVWQPYDEAASKYFKVGKRPTIAETIAYYRERKIGLDHVHGRQRVRDRREAHPEPGGRRRRGREQRHHDRVRVDRSAQGPHGRARGARADQGRRHQGLQVPSDRAGIFPERPHGLQALRGDRRAQAAGDFSHRPFRHRHRHARRRRPAAQIFQSDSRRRRRGRFSRHDDHHRASVLAVADEALSICLHKPNVYIDLSGWSPKYFPAESCDTPTASSSTRCCSARTFR